MSAAFIIMLREGLEAALIVGIVLAVLARLGQRGRNRHVAYGVGLAVVGSIGFALLADGVTELFEGAGQEILNGVVLGVAAVTITYVVVWVRGRQKGIGQQLAEQVEQAGVSGLGVMLLVFVTVFREGAEAVLFLWGVMLSGAGATLSATLTGALLGLSASAAIAWGVFASGRRVPLKVFFNITMGLLVLLAAGMLTSAVGLLVSVEWLPALEYAVWDTRHLLAEDSGLGALFGILFGYNANPTLMEVLAYAGYLLMIGAWFAADMFRRPQAVSAGG
ncbi:MAG: FTR1 family protein [Leptospirillia bacterium]